MTPAEVEKLLQDAFYEALQAGQRIHDPSSYVHGPFGTPTEVMNAIGSMVSKGFLYPWYFGLCKAGHAKYSGLSEGEAEDHLGDECTKCPKEILPRGQHHTDGSYVRCVYALYLPGEDE
jgi:hypothetical protein